MSIFVSLICALSVGAVQSRPASLAATSQLAPMSTSAKTDPLGQVVLGKLGQATMPCDIYSEPDIGSKIYYTAKAHQYLVINPAAEAGWHKVLLQNGLSGYVQADSVKVTNFQVLTTDAARRAKSHRAVDVALRKRAEIRDSGQRSAAFVSDVFTEIGLKLPTDAEKQSKIGKSIASLEKLASGDRLYFWSDEAGKITDAGIYTGNGSFLFMDREIGEVDFQSLSDKKWLKRLVVARR